MQRKRLIAGCLTAAHRRAALVDRQESAQPLPQQGSTGAAASTEGAEPAAAEAFLRGTLDAARKGDVAAYLASFGGAFASAWNTTSSSGAGGLLATTCKQAAKARKGHALYAPEPDGPGRLCDHGGVGLSRPQRAPGVPAGAFLGQLADHRRGDRPRPHAEARGMASRPTFQAPQDVPVPTEEPADPLDSTARSVTFTRTPRSSSEHLS